MYKYIFAYVAVIFLFTSAPALADCTNPAKAEGVIIYNSDHKVAQFCNGTDWVGMAGGTTSIMTGDTMVEGWPDALVCNGSSGTIVLWQSYSGSLVRYDYNLSSTHTLAFTLAGAYSAGETNTTGDYNTDCRNKSISQLYADGQAFNFVGGGSGSGPGSDTLAGLSCTDGQMVLYDTATTAWICADVSASGAADNLGNHTATQNLNLANFEITNAAGITLDSVAGGAAPSSGDSGGGVPAGAVMAFDLASCPTGWSEYTAARGRFPRGIDPTGTNDPDGVRTAGSVQVDAFQDHDHTPEIYSGTPTSGGNWQFAPGAFTTSNSLNYDPYPTDPPVKRASYNGSGGGGHDRGYRTSTETRPKNFAVLYCRKD